MARIDALPSIDIIRGLKGILDFYLWRGLPCVRAWPRYRPARQTEAALASALLFGAVIKAFSLTARPVLDQLAIEATGIPRTPRDIYVSGVYGNLHEASMSDFLTLLTECRDYLLALTAILNALDTIDTDELVVNVDQSVLPPTAAIDAHQLTQITALQKLDDLQDALQSTALDRLLVRGMDQLFSFKAVLAEKINAIISGAGGFIDSDPCPANTIWCVTNIQAFDATNPTTEHRFQLRHDGISYGIGEQTAALAALDSSYWNGLTWLDYQDTIRVYYIGALAGDTCYILLSGYAMTLET